MVLVRSSPHGNRTMSGREPNSCSWRRVNSARSASYQSGAGPRRRRPTRCRTAWSRRRRCSPTSTPGAYQRVVGVGRPRDEQGGRPVGRIHCDGGRCWDPEGGEEHIHASGNPQRPVVCTRSNPITSVAGPRRSRDGSRTAPGCWCSGASPRRDRRRRRRTGCASRSGSPPAGRPPMLCDRPCRRPAA